MESRKKRYTAPELIVHGDLGKITRSGGGSNWDIPEGTTITIGPGIDPGDVTS